MKKVFLLFIIALVFGTTACKNDDGDDSPPPSPTNTEAPAELKITYEVDGTPLEYDTLKYKSPFNITYKVNRLQYYISEITFRKTDGTVLKTWEKGARRYFYMDGIKEPVALLDLGKLPEGEYNKITFHVGLPADLNQHGAIDNTTENTNMIWPTMMGGGYHFTKFEGKFLRPVVDTLAGFAIHIGTNSALVNVTVNLTTPLKISGTSKVTIPIAMNLNEWMHNPYDYDFSSQKSYTMMDSTLRVQLAANGADAFYYKGN